MKTRGREAPGFSFRTAELSRKIGASRLPVTVNKKTLNSASAMSASGRQTIRGNAYETS
jgi:hypothetical protein